MKLASATTKASVDTSAVDPQQPDRAGDPNCPHCGGAGYLRRDLPVNHPEFGRVVPCVCRTDELQARFRQRLYSLSQLGRLADLTFDSFRPEGRTGIGDAERTSVDNAFQRARQYAERLDGWLLLQGSYGTGKTHLAAAIANQAVANSTPTLFLTVPDLLDLLRASFGANEMRFDERFDQVRNAPLLVLDDLGTHSATDWAREKLFQIVNYRYVNALPLVLTTNLPLDRIEGRLRSRLSDLDRVVHVEIRAPDYRRSADEGSQDLVSSLALHKGQTFGNFNFRQEEGLPRKELASLRAAFDQALAFAQEPDGWLAVFGTYGTGKTHLAAAIANYQDSNGQPVRFVVVPDLLDHLRATFNPDAGTSYDRLFEDLRRTPMLVLDDLGSQATSAWAREKLFQLFNYRYNARLPTVVTTAEPPDKFDPRLLTRMNDPEVCRVIELNVPPYHRPRSGRR